MTDKQIIAELTAHVHELEKLLDESQCYAAGLDTRLRELLALKADTPVGEFYTPGTIGDLMKASLTKRGER